MKTNRYIQNIIDHSNEKEKKINQPTKTYYIITIFHSFLDNQTKVIVGTAVAVGTLTAAGLAYLYLKKVEEPIPTK